MAICNQTIGFPGLVFKDLNRIRESVNEFLDVSHHITQSFHDQPNVAVYTEAVPSAPVYAEAHVVSHDPVASPYEPVVVKPSNVSVYNGYP